LLKLEDGTEKPIQLSGCDIPLKEGHKIAEAQSFMGLADIMAVAKEIH
jgi:hypothetical protein